MKPINHRLIAVICSILFSVSAIPISSSFALNGHENHEPIEWLPTGTAFVKGNAGGCGVQITLSGYCSHGVNTGKTMNSVSYASNHGPTQSEIGPHTGNKHKITDTCTRCSYLVSSGLFACSGPPCIALYGERPEVDDLVTTLIEE